MLLVLLTFLLGAALSRVSLCAVAAAQQCAAAREVAGLLRLLLAACASGIALLALSRVLLAPELLPRHLPIGGMLIMGSMLLAAGALLNGACYLGSVLYAGSGNANYLFTLIGLGAGMRGIEWWATPHDSPAFAAPVSTPTVAATLWWSGLLLYGLVVVLALRSGRTRGVALWPLLAGLLAGLVYACQPGWSYGHVIGSLARGDWRANTWLGNGAALALFAGAIAGSIAAGRWRWQRPSAVRVLRCLAGGALMGIAAMLIPGGNDMLLLWSIPGLALYGGVAYGIMLLVLVLMFGGAEIWRRRARAATKLGT